MTTTGRVKKWSRITMLAVAVLVLLGAVGLWLMFQHIPAWYLPVEVPPGQVQSVRDDFVSTFDRLSEWFNRLDRPFEYRLTQRQINAWLASRERIWPSTSQWLPAGVSDPHIVIERDGLRFAVTVRRHGVRTVVNAKLRLGVDDEGVRVQLDEVYGGSLPLPRSWIREQLAALDTGPWPTGRRPAGQLDGPPLPALADLYRGVALASGWVWRNGRRPFRIRGLALEPGAVTMTFEPLARSLARGAATRAASRPAATQQRAGKPNRTAPMKRKPIGPGQGRAPKSHDEFVGPGPDHAVSALIAPPDRPPPAGDGPFVVQVRPAVIRKPFGGQRRWRARPAEASGVVADPPGRQRVPAVQHQVPVPPVR